MNKKAIAGLLGAASLVTLAACNNNNKASGDSSSNAKTEERKFASDVTNEGTAIKGGTVNYAMVSASPFKGLINPLLYVDSGDGTLVDFAFAQLFEFDANQRIKKDGGMMEFTLDKENKTVTLKLRSKDYKWSDGQPLTIDDYIFTYEFIGRKDYEGVRYDENAENIVGMKDYHEGKADKISGITEKDNKTVVVKYTEIKPSVLFGEGWITNVLNAKQVADASKDFAKFAEADLNKKPLSFGPYVIAKEVNGESVLAEANPHYYKKDDVKVKKIEFKVVSPAQASSVIKNGDVDVLPGVTANVWDSSKDLKNGDFLSKPSYYLSYVGFRTGQWDKEKSENVEDPDSKLKDKNVRQAFELAVDRDQINEKVFKGLRFTPTGSGMYPPATGKLQNENATAVKKDVEKAKKLLDEAGYKDTDGDGLREDKNGKKVTFNFAIRNTGADYDQALADTFIKAWKEVGLDVQLVDGKLMSPKDFSSRLLAGDKSIDIFQGAWQLGTNPDRSSMLGRKTPLNLYRYTSSTFDEAFKEQSSDAMFDDAKLKEAYNKFDNLVADELPYFPLSWDTDLTWVNKRVKALNPEKLGKGQQKLHALELNSQESAK